MINKKILKVETGRVIYIKNNKILLTKGENDEVYQTPGGWCDKNEKSINTAVREFNEELGINLNIDDLEYVFTITSERKAKSCEGDFDLVQKKEHFFHLTKEVKISKDIVDEDTGNFNVKSVQMVALEEFYSEDFPIFPSSLKEYIQNTIMYLRAREFAKKAHGEQKYGERNYSHHLQQVDKIVNDFAHLLKENAILKIKTCAWLHDIIEDTEITKSDLEKEFNSTIAGIVYKVSNNKKSNEIPYKKICNCNNAKLIKLFDRLANMENCCITKSTRHIKKYVEQYPQLKEYLYMSKYDELWQRLEKAYNKMIGILKEKNEY